jgi:hypothetical protein
VNPSANANAGSNRSGVAGDGDPGVVVDDVEPLQSRLAFDAGLLGDAGLLSCDLERAGKKYSPELDMDRAATEERWRAEQ